jgi:methyltransferase-like protein/SAM-dependent methyltransferase
LRVENSYDQVPYPSLSYTQSHPDRLATLATLLGMHPPPVERCRVLELGCASGGNLIPMAYGLPESEFVGIDYAARQVAEGQAAVAALGLENIALKHLDIMEVDAGLGQFDYIIAHGIYSWVTDGVRDKILAVCRENLAPNGVAYVSYNTYPGWHMLNIARDMMLYHTREVAEPQERVAQARALLDFLADSVPVENSAYGSFLKMYAQFLKGEVESARPRDDSFLLHDELEEVNEPVYFYQFVEQAARHGLQYLAETELRTMVDSNFPPQVSATLCRMAQSAVELEQYMDFVRNRTFRQTLLCHQDVPLNRTLKPDCLRGFHVASRAEPAVPDPDVHSVSVVKFRGSDGATLSTDHPITKAAMLVLNEMWPQAVPFDTLLAAARARLAAVQAGAPPLPVGGEGAPAAPGIGEGSSAPDAQGQGDDSSTLDAQVLGTNLLKAYSYSGSLAELHVYAPLMAREASERPVASPLARFQARRGTLVTNLRHERVTLDAFNRHLLRHLDGSHDRAALLERFLAGPVAEGVLKVEQNGAPVEDAREIQATLAEALEWNLYRLARAALLVG